MVLGVSVNNPVVYVLVENASRILGVFTGDDALDKAKEAARIPDGLTWEDKPSASHAINEDISHSFWQAVRFETNITYPFDPKHLFNNEGKL